MHNQNPNAILYCIKTVKKLWLRDDLAQVELCLKTWRQEGIWNNCCFHVSWIQGGWYMTQVDHIRNKLTTYHLDLLNDYYSLNFKRQKHCFRSLEVQSTPSCEINKFSNKTRNLSYDSFSRDSKVNSGKVSR